MELQNKIAMVTLSLNAYSRPLSQAQKKGLKGEVVLLLWFFLPIDLNYGR
jgi:hypothetical protein